MTLTQILIYLSSATCNPLPGPVCQLCNYTFPCSLARHRFSCRPPQHNRESCGSGSRSWHRISVAPPSPASVPIRADDHTGKYRIREGRDRHLNRAHSPPLRCPARPSPRSDPPVDGTRHGGGNRGMRSGVQCSLQVPQIRFRDDVGSKSTYQVMNVFANSLVTPSHATHGSKILLRIEERLMRGEFLSPHSSANRVCRPPPSLRHRSSHVSLSFFPRRYIHT